MGRIWMRAAVVGLVGVALGVAPVAPTSAGQGRITVTEVRNAEGRRFEALVELNDRGQVAAITQPAGGEPTAALWFRGRTVRLAPEGVSAFYGDLSDRGQAVGFFLNPDFVVTGAFSWYRGRWTELTTQGDGAAVAVNERRQVLGTRTRFDPRPVEETVVWNRDGTVTVAPADVVPTGGFNDRGQATVLLPAVGQAGVWQAGGEVTLLGSLGGDPAATDPTHINEAGHVAGSAQTADGESHAFLWRDGVMTDLGTLGGASSRVTVLNDRDEVIVAGETAAGGFGTFLWRDGERIDLGGLMPVDVNDRGHVAGNDGQRAFLLRDGERIDLGAAAGAQQSSAREVNNRDQVLGAADGRDVLWTVR